MACNQVWNYCNAFQRDIESRYRAGAPKRRWPSAFDLAKLCKGTGKELGIHQQTVGTVCDQYAKSRDKAKHSLRFRSQLWRQAGTRLDTVSKAEPTGRG